MEAKRKQNTEIEKIEALESKLFELIKQESPDDYSAVIVKDAISLLKHRIYRL